MRTIRTLAACLGLFFALLVGGCCCAPRDGGSAVASEPRQVFLDFEVVQVPEAQIAAMLGADRPTADHNPRLLPAARAESLLRLWRASPEVHVLSGPKMLTVDGQSASLFVGDSIRFAKTVVDGENLVVADEPEKNTWVGERIRVQPTVTAGRTIALDFHGEWREMVGDDPAHLRGNVIALQFAVPDKGWALLGTPELIETNKSGRVLHVVLLRAEVLDPRDIGVDLRGIQAPPSAPHAPAGASPRN